MLTLPSLEPSHVALEGIHLIEASAGTGKTYTIASLVLRLILERGLTVDQILIVTFTKAATDELRERIRQRLLDGRSAFEQGQSDEPVFAELLCAVPDYAQAQQRLTFALQSFDEAAIFTIHGFCQRVLSESAFETGWLFDAEITPDDGDIRQQIIDDFWRNETANISLGVAQYLSRTNITPDSLRKELDSWIGRDDVRVIPDVDVGDIDALHDDLQAAHRKFQAQWPEARAGVDELMRSSTALKRNSYQLKSLPDRFTALDVLADLGSPVTWLADDTRHKVFTYFSSSKITNSTKAKQIPPEHPLFDVCECLLVAYSLYSGACEDALLKLKSDCLAFAQAEMTRRKQLVQRQSYDDLLLEMRAALRSSQGPALLRGLRRQFPAGLIDEFQDTDSVQYEIFRRIYADQPGPLFLIGDPKQAIYSFRGADIFTYMAAKRDAQHAHTLGTNYRSQAHLVAAINQLFERPKNAFLFDDIPFQPVNAGRPARADGAALRIGWLDESDDGKVPNKENATRQAVIATAREIQRLLASNQFMARDIAVLVRSHKEGQAVAKALAQYDIKSSFLSQQNVFASDEASDLLRCLSAIVEPTNTGRINAALSCRLMGVDALQLHQLQNDERAWADWIGRFQDWLVQWQRHGFSASFADWQSASGLRPRLLKLADGERRVTNVQHLTEILQTQSLRAAATPEGLVKWFSDQIAEAHDGKDEDAQLRLESDESLVKIITIHKSKGLEFPVVFCPFLWSARKAPNKNALLAYHAPDQVDQPGQWVLDLGSEHRNEESVPQVEYESLAEDIRLAYVALTRASERCYITWGKVSGCERTALTYLLHHDDQDNTLEGFRARVKKLGDVDMRNVAQALVAKSGGAIALETLSDGVVEQGELRLQPVTQLRARPFTGRIVRDWRVTSFSGLTSHHAAHTELPDYDLAVEPATPEPQPVQETPQGPNIYTFPKGAQAGIMMHALFEFLDFRLAQRPLLEPYVEDTLQQHGFDLSWRDVLVDMLLNVLATPLLDEVPDFTLGQLDNAQRLNELAFYFPLQALSVGGLQQVFEQAGGNHWRALAPEIALLRFGSLRGFMKGFIDLVFEWQGRYYVLDYKSNWLGAHIGDYTHDDIATALSEHLYDLQYMIYSVALHRYLRLRIPDYSYHQHFGGSVYLFLRGMHPESGTQTGVFFDRPDFALIDALDRYFGSHHAE